MPTWSIAVIGLPRDPTNPVAERIEVVTLDHIVRLEPLVRTSAST